MVLMRRTRCHRRNTKPMPSRLEDSGATWLARCRSDFFGFLRGSAQEQRRDWPIQPSRMMRWSIRGERRRRARLLRFPRDQRLVRIEIVDHAVVDASSRPIVAHAVDSFARLCWALLRALRAWRFAGRAACGWRLACDGKSV